MLSRVHGGAERVTAQVGGFAQHAGCQSGCRSSVCIVSELIAIAIAAAIALLAWWARSLSGTGAVAAALVGGAVFAHGGLAWGLPLIVAFVTCSALSQLRRRHSAEAGCLAEAGRGSRRDAVQVLANGGVALPLVGLDLMWPDPRWALGWWACCAALAADTWATELGRWVGHAPRRLLDGRRLAPGDSGGVTVPGSLGGALGALAIAACTLPWAAPAAAVLVAACGVAGMLLDSALGCVQGRWRCTACGAVGEERRHCDQRGLRVAGLGWLDNDVVNLLSTAMAAAAAVAAAAVG